MGPRYFGSALLAALAVVACNAKPQPGVHLLGPGVWARAIPAGAQTGTNQGWIEFHSFVMIVDTDVFDTEMTLLEAVSETTDKPIRYVIDTHFHGDHSHGNGRFTALGAEVVAADAARESFDRAERDFQRAKENRKTAYDGIDFVAPMIWFAREMIIEDDGQRVELLYLGPAHTDGDTLVWLPGQGVLFSGDVVAKDHLTFLGDGNIESWIEVLAQLEQLPVRVLVPGHGPLGDMETIRKQRSFLTDLRDAVFAQVDAGVSDAEEIAHRIKLPAHPLWRKQQEWFRLRGVRCVLRGMQTP